MDHHSHLTSRDDCRNPHDQEYVVKQAFQQARAAISEITGKPGSILNNDFIIGCADKSIEITEIQKEGKNKLLLKDFLSGISFKIDDLVE